MPIDIVFLHPGAAWLLLVLPLLWWPRLWGAGRRHGGRGWYGHLALRTALFAGLVAALMQPAVVRHSDGGRRIMVVDRAAWASAGAAPQGRAQQAALLAQIARADAGLVLIETGDGPAVLAQAPGLAARLADHVVIPGTALSLALEEAVARVPPGVGARVLVAGSGAARDADWGRAVSGLLARRIAVDAVMLRDGAAPPRVAQIEVPPVRVGELARASVVIAGGGPRPVRVTLWSGGQRIALSTPFVPAPGQRVDLVFPAQAAGFMPLRARLEDAGGQPLPGSARETFAAVQDPLHLLYLGQGRQGAVPRLQALVGKGFAVEARDPASLAGAAAPGGWAGWQAVMIDDLPAARLAAPAQRGLLASVAQSGTGLFFSGGAAAFAGGGWNGTPLARALPVTLHQDQKLEQPSIALVVVLDTSGSMMGEPLDLAKQVARYAVGQLTPADSVGVVEFYGAKQWAVPLQPASDVAGVERAIARMQAQGSSILYPAIQEAYFALKSSTARYKHILVITDAGVEEQRYQQLLTRAAQDRIAVSTALVGADLAGEERMAEWARWGHGRYYAVPDAFSLVDIDLRQPQIKPSPAWRQGAFALHAPGGPVPWQGMRLGGMPPLSGYVPVGRRAEAETLLQAGTDGDPVLASWQWGNGRITTLMTTPLGDGTRGWAAWPGYGAWLGQLLSRTASQQPPGTLTLQRGADGQVTVLSRRADGPGSAPALHLADSPTLPMAQMQKLALAPRAPGVFSATTGFDPARPVLAEMGVGVANVRAALGAQAAAGAAFHLPLAGLARLTGGTAMPLDDVRLPALPDAGELVATDLSRWCALLSLLLYLAEIVWRRWPARRRRA